MRQALLAGLLVLLALSLAGSASPAPRYPTCPPKVGDRTLTSTSQRGDEAYPQIVCWYEDKQPVYEFNAGWTTERYKGFAGLGCGKSNEGSLMRINSYTHDAYVQTNGNFQNMPGFEAAIDEFLDRLEVGYAQACGAEKLNLISKGSGAKPGKGAGEHCSLHGANPSCAAMEDGQLKVCNGSKDPAKFRSTTKNNKFTKKLEPGKCLLRELADPGSNHRIKLSAADRGGVYALFVYIDLVVPNEDR